MGDAQFRSKATKHRARSGFLAMRTSSAGVAATRGTTQAMIWTLALANPLLTWVCLSPPPSPTPPPTSFPSLYHRSTQTPPPLPPQTNKKTVFPIPPSSAKSPKPGPPKTAKNHHPSPGQLPPCPLPSPRPPGSCRGDCPESQRTTDDDQLTMNGLSGLPIAAQVEMMDTERPRLASGVPGFDPIDCVPRARS